MSGENNYTLTPTRFLHRRQQPLAHDWMCAPSQKGTAANSYETAITCPLDRRVAYLNNIET